MTSKDMSGSPGGQVDNRRRSNFTVGNRKEVSRFKRMLLTPGALFLIWSPLAVILVWQVITNSIGAYLAVSQPEIALQLESTSATALVKLANDKLNGGKPGANSAAPAKLDRAAVMQIRSWAEQALRNDPLNARAFRILGQLSQRDGDEKRTKTLMQAAVRRSLHESAAVYWLMQKNYEDQDYHAAIRHADTLLSTRQERSGIIGPVLSVLAKIAELEGPGNEVERLLARNPPWRSIFFRSLSNKIADARTPLGIFLALRDTPAPATAEERLSYINFLVSRGFYDLAYYTWLQFLPTEQLSHLGRLYNGDFQAPPSGVPFDWQFTPNPGVTIEVTSRLAAGEGEGDALFIKFFGEGRVDFSGLSQLLVLAPGSYEFRGKQKSDVISKKGLGWHITCAKAPNNRIGESPTVNGTDLGWKDFAFSFTVPETDCSAQTLRLASEARSASEQFISGSIWFDDLQVVRHSTDGP